MHCLGLYALAAAMLPLTSLRAVEPKSLVKERAFKQLTEPPCSYCVNQNRKGLLGPNERVLAWVRGAHNGGAFPLRHFIAAPRVINDTYGIFFYDPDGGYVAGYKKDYGYEFHGWRSGVMTVKHKDGTVFSALSGLGLEGPRKDARLPRIPTMLTNWGHWLMLHPESTAYDLFDGTKYPMAELPVSVSGEAKETMNDPDRRLPVESMVVGLEAGDARLAVPVDFSKERDCFNVEAGGKPVAVFVYGLTQSAIAWERNIAGQTLTFYADQISPETAPFKDKETGTRWTLAGRGVDGPLRNQELTWAPSIACKWYAWCAENPGTEVYAKRAIEK
ncbi:MAG: DUF3179 domain-containing (seleno)protein [Verrucomicrobiales bacterium]